MGSWNIGWANFPENPLVVVLDGAWWFYQDFFHDLEMVKTPVPLDPQQAMEKWRF